MKGGVLRIIRSRSREKSERWVGERERKRGKQYERKGVQKDVIEKVGIQRTRTIRTSRTKNEGKRRKREEGGGEYKKKKDLKGKQEEEEKRRKGRTRKGIL